MISLDLETTGLDPAIHDFCSIGAVHLESGEKFYLENKIWPSANISHKALEKNGFTTAELKDSSKPNPEVAVKRFLEWVEEIVPEEERVLMGCNVGTFDYKFLKDNSEYIFYEEPFGHRFVDIFSMWHTITGRTDSALKNGPELWDIEPDPEPHNALEGAKLNVRLYNHMISLVQDHGTIDVDPFFITNSGVEFYPLSPSVDMININDIANGLSNNCRWTGQTNEFYSIAQHSIAVAETIKELGGTTELAMQGLLHDAVEAYICDIPSPVKQHLPGYVKLEKSLLPVVGEALGVDLENLHEIVKYADKQMLYLEAKHLFDDGLAEWAEEPEVPKPSIVDHYGKDFNAIGAKYMKRIFLHEYNKLKKQL